MTAVAIAVCVVLSCVCMCVRERVTRGTRPDSTDAGHSVTPVVFLNASLPPEPNSCSYLALSLVLRARNHRTGTQRDTKEGCVCV